MTAGKHCVMAGIGQQRDSGRESTAGKRWGRAKEAEEESREGDAERWRLGKDVKRGGRNEEPFGEGQAIATLLDPFFGMDSQFLPSQTLLERLLEMLLPPYPSFLVEKTASSSVITIN
jgi:hypothetical protein